MASPPRMMVQLGANVEQLVQGMNQAISVIRGAGAQITGELRGMKESSEKHARGMQEALERSGHAIEGLLGPLAELFTAYKAFETVKGFVEMGIEANKVQEQAAIGVGAIVFAQTTLRDSTGQTIEGMNALDAAIVLSREQIEKLNLEAVKVGVSSETLFKGFETAAALGLKSGASLDQIRQLTVLTAEAMRSLGRDMSELPATLKAIETGMGAQRNILAISLGVTKQWVESFKEPGALIDALITKMKPFGEAMDRQGGTFAVVVERIKGAIEIIAEEMTKPLFEGMKEGMGDLSRVLFDFKGLSISGSLSGLMDAARGLFVGLGEVARSAIGGLVEILDRLGRWFTENRERAAAFGAAVVGFASAGAGAFTNFLSSMLALVSMGLGPLTVALNVASALLSSTVVQMAAFVAIGAGAIGTFMRLGSLITAVFSFQPLVAGFGAVKTVLVDTVKIATLFQTHLALARMEGLTGMAALKGAFESAKMSAGSLGGGILGLINPWVLLAVGIGGAGIALERWITSGARAAAEQNRLAGLVRQNGEEWRQLTKEAIENDAFLSKTMPTSASFAVAFERRLALIKQLNLIYPDFNKFLVDEAGHQRSLAEAIKLANGERQKELNSKIAGLEAQLASAKSARDALSGLVAQAGVTGAGIVGAGTGLIAAWKLSAAEKQVNELTEALKKYNAEKLAASTTADSGTTLDPKPIPDPDLKEKQLVSQWRDEMEARKAEVTRYREWDKADELSFWSEKVGEAKKGTEAYAEVVSTLNKLEAQNAKEWRDDQEKAEKQRAAAQLEDAKRIVEANKKRLKAEQDDAEEWARIRSESQKSAQDIALEDIGTQEKQAQALLDQGRISHDEYLAELQRFEDARYEIELQGIIDRFNLKGGEADPAVLRELTALKSGHGAATKGIVEQKYVPGQRLAKGGMGFKNEGGWLGALDTGLTGAADSFSQQWMAGIGRMLDGTLKFSQAVKGLWHSIGSTFRNMAAQMVQDWLASALKRFLWEKLFGEQGLLVHLGILKVKDKAAVKSGLTNVSVSASEGGAAAAASAAKIPMIGWMIAIGAGLAVLASVLAMRSHISSAAGGWDIGPMDPGLARLHAREMVLPAPLADRIRDMTGGSGGSSVSVNIGGITAMDGADVERVLISNQGALAKAIRRAARDGRLGR